MTPSEDKKWPQGVKVYSTRPLLQARASACRKVNGSLRPRMKCLHMVEGCTPSTYCSLPIRPGVASDLLIRLPATPSLLHVHSNLHAPSVIN